jgi:hypothetical protein
MGTTMSQFAAEYAKTLNVKNKPFVGVSTNKFKAIKTQVGDITFDSKIEARFYVRLCALRKANLIKSVDIQPKHLLQEGFVDRCGIKHQPMYYIGDFEVVFPDGTIKIYDTKGNKTKEYGLKKKLLLFRYQDIIFEEVFSADEHPVHDRVLMADEVKAIKKEAARKSAEWKEKFTKKT